MRREQKKGGKEENYKKYRVPSALMHLKRKNNSFEKS